MPPILDLSAPPPAPSPLARLAFSLLLALSLGALALSFWSEPPASLCHTRPPP